MLFSISRRYRHPPVPCPDIPCSLTLYMLCKRQWDHGIHYRPPKASACGIYMKASGCPVLLWYCYFMRRHQKGSGSSGSNFFLFPACAKNPLQYTGSPCPHTVTGFCRCFAFRIGKIRGHNGIIRNFQFRKFLPMQSNKGVTVLYKNFSSEKLLMRRGDLIQWHR